MSRILYLCHDNPKPSGGIRTLYRHVGELVKAGFDAAIVHFKPGFNPDWFSDDVPVINANGNLEVQLDDWVVIPEDYHRAMEAFSRVPCRKAIFCQNHYYVFDALPSQKSWKDYGISEIIVSSTEIKKFVKNVFNIDAPHIPLAINHELFSPGPALRETSICYMPRKGHWNIRQIMGILWHRSPKLRSVPWIPVENMSENEVATTMKKCALFLSTGFREGFGLPPVEAMACGCIVVGFKAGGGQEYAHEGNGFWVPDEDPLAFADTLETVLGMFERKHSTPHLDSIRQEGYKTASHYTFERQSKRLIELWSELLK